jgi:hypothetical protein
LLTSCLTLTTTPLEAEKIMNWTDVRLFFFGRRFSDDRPQVATFTDDGKLRTDTAINVDNLQANLDIGASKRYHYNQVSVIPATTEVIIDELMPRGKLNKILLSSSGDGIFVVKINNVVLLTVNTNRNQPSMYLDINYELIDPVRVVVEVESRAMGTANFSCTLLMS